MHYIVKIIDSAGGTGRTFGPFEDHDAAIEVLSNAVLGTYFVNAELWSVHYDDEGQWHEQEMVESRP